MPGKRQDKAGGHSTTRRQSWSQQQAVACARLEAEVAALMQQLQVEERRRSSLLFKERTLAALVDMHEPGGAGPSAHTLPERLALQTQEHLQARAHRSTSLQPSTSADACDEADLHLLANVAAIRRLGQMAPRQLALLEQLHPSGWPVRGSAVECVLQRVGPHGVLWRDAESFYSWLSGLCSVALPLLLQTDAQAQQQRLQELGVQMTAGALSMALYDSRLFAEVLGWQCVLDESSWAQRDKVAASNLLSLLQPEQVDALLVACAAADEQVSECRRALSDVMGRLTGVASDGKGGGGGSGAAKPSGSAVLAASDVGLAALTEAELNRQRMSAATVMLALATATVMEPETAAHWFCVSQPFMPRIMNSMLAMRSMRSGAQVGD